MPSAASPGSQGSSPDVVIVGDGIVALTLALALARRGASSRIVGAPRPGVASTAAAGLLAPSVGSTPETVRPFMLAARDYYPQFVAALIEASGRDVHLGPQGILEIALTAEQFGQMRASASPEALALDPRAVHEMERALAPVAGALFHPRDGVIDTGQLVAALGAAAARSEHISVVRQDVSRVDVSTRSAAAVAADGTRHEAGRLVLAAGTWSANIAGLPRPLPISPARGQMLDYTASPLSHAVMGPGGYLVPRPDRTIAGSTLERVGFDASTTPAALAGIAEVAKRFAPVLQHTPIGASWAGLRPVTPDMLPILGSDPDHPSLVYACGHSKNGILTAPLAAECLAAVMLGSEPMMDIGAFSVGRFA